MRGFVSHAAFWQQFQSFIFASQCYPSHMSWSWVQDANTCMCCSHSLCESVTFVYTMHTKKSVLQISLFSNMVLFLIIWGFFVFYFPKWMRTRNTFYFICLNFQISNWLFLFCRGAAAANHASVRSTGSPNVRAHIQVTISFPYCSSLWNLCVESMTLLSFISF